MRYIKLNFKYLIKNILFVFLLSLIPAIFMGSLLNPFKFLEFVNNYANIVVVNFADIFYNIIDISWLKLLFYVIGFFLTDFNSFMGFLQFSPYYFSFPNKAAKLFTSATLSIACLFSSCICK